MLPMSLDEIRGTLPAQFVDPAERAWALDALTPMTRREALTRAPWLASIIDAATDQYGRPVTMRFYSCDRLDPETKRCTRYDERPAVCRDYPMYGRIDAPPEAAVLPPTCSYLTLRGGDPAVPGST